MNKINIIKNKFIYDLSNVFSLSEIISIWNNWVIVEILKMKRIDLIKNHDLLIPVCGHEEAVIAKDGRL